MENKNNKDIVDQIIEKMKATEELPYKEGSWENFQHRYDPVVPKRNKTFFWAASAAAILLIGLFAIRNWGPDQVVSENEIAKNNSEQNPIENSITENRIGTEQMSSDEDAVIVYENNLSSKRIDNQNIVASSSSPRNVQGKLYGLMGNYSDNPLINLRNSIQMPSALNSYSKESPMANITLDDTEYKTSGNGVKTELAYNNNVNQNGNAPDLKSRKFNLLNKFDLGLFVSPNSTNERFNFGGGVLLSYNINKNVSVRTGLAYNKYDVSVLKDPIANSETPVLASQEAIQKITTNGLTQQYASNNAIVLPNVNAITGNVQALEIPLDIRVKSKDCFYASSGLTYAAVFNQNRYTHYVENANSELFGNGLPENEADVKNAVQQVSRAIKTEDENISSNGFGGFVNLSIGKEMKMNKSMKISVEPYLKLPVGSFKRADMNYTNGGIRIITNF